MRKKHQKPKKKQRRDYLALIAHFAAAIYWLIRLVLLIMDLLKDR